MYTFHPRALHNFPEAPGFLEALVTRGSVSTAVARQYVTIAGRLKRQGRLGDVQLLTNSIERTAANAYRRWRRESYSEMIAPVQRVLGPRLLNRAALPWLRRHAIVPPVPGKLVPRYKLGSAGELEWVPSDAWTLHVPEKPSPVHIDPCSTCATIELTTEQLNVVAEAFEKAWGHRDLSKVVPESFLFGDPPPEGVSEKTSANGDRVVALSGRTVTAEVLEAVNARITVDVEAFVARLHEGADGVYLSRAACAGKLGDVLEAVRAAWTS